MYFIGKNKIHHFVDEAFTGNADWISGDYDRKDEIILGPYNIPRWKILVRHKKRGETLGFQWCYYPWNQIYVQSE